MKVLALELSSARGSVALRDEGQLEFDREWPNNRKNSGPFFECLAEVREKLAKLDRRMPVFRTENLPKLKESELRYPAANMLSRLASESTRNFSQPPLEPMYLREPHITIPRK